MLVMCNDRPGYGGAATNAYNIIRELGAQGIFVNCSPHHNIDPDGLGDIYHCYEYIFGPGYEKQVIEYAKGFDPSLVLCKNSSTVKYAKQLWPSVKVVYLCPGPSGILSVQDTDYVINVNDNEAMAVDLANVIVFNGEFTRDLFKRVFPDHESKIFPEIIDTSALHADYPEYDTTKTYDIIMASSILTRPEKNNMFLIDILSQTSASKIIVGNDNDAFLDIPNSIIYDLVPQEQLLWLLAQSKILVFPSIYDSNPSTVKEALHYGCQVLVSANLDISKQLPDEFVCQSFDPIEWQTKLSVLLEKTVPYIHVSEPCKLEKLVDNM